MTIYNLFSCEQSYGSLVNVLCLLPLTNNVILPGITWFASPASQTKITLFASNTWCIEKLPHPAVTLVLRKGDLSRRIIRGKAVLFKTLMAIDKAKSRCHNSVWCIFHFYQVRISFILRLRGRSIVCKDLYRVRCTLCTITIMMLWFPFNKKEPDYFPFFLFSIDLDAWFKCNEKRWLEYYSLHNVYCKHL